MASVSRAVLITGCSTGIGRATAEQLAARGWTVYATARRPESIRDLAGRGCKTLALDVCDEASMRAAVETVERAEGAVGVLVNNAGYGQEGAFEGPMGRFAADPEAVARVIERAIAAERPRTRYPVTFAARFLMGLRRWLPDRAFDGFLRTQFPVSATR